MLTQTRSSPARFSRFAKYCVYQKHQITNIRVQNKSSSNIPVLDQNQTPADVSVCVNTIHAFDLEAEACDRTFEAARIDPTGVSTFQVWATLC